MNDLFRTEMYKERAKKAAETRKRNSVERKKKEVKPETPAIKKKYAKEMTLEEFTEYMCSGGILAQEKAKKEKWW